MVARTVDLHHHVIPDFHWEASNEGGHSAGGITPPGWSLAGDLAYLDEAGIDVVVLSISTPGVHFGDDAAARVLARRTNEYLAETVRRATRLWSPPAVRSYAPLRSHGRSGSTSPSKRSST